MTTTVRSEGREAQTEVNDAPNIVYHDKLHEQNDSLQRRFDAEQELRVARENDLKFERQQNAILASSVRQHEARWVHNLDRMITVHPCGDVYHNSPNCRWLRGGRTLSLCTLQTSVTRTRRQHDRFI